MKQKKVRSVYIAVNLENRSNEFCKEIGLHLELKSKSCVTRRILVVVIVVLFGNAVLWTPKSSNVFTATAKMSFVTAKTAHGVSATCAMTAAARSHNNTTPAVIFLSSKSECWPSARNGHRCAASAVSSGSDATP